MAYQQIFLTHLQAKFVKSGADKFTDFRPDFFFRGMKTEINYLYVLNAVCVARSVNSNSSLRYIFGTRSTSFGKWQNNMFNGLPSLISLKFNNVIVVRIVPLHMIARSMIHSL